MGTFITNQNKSGTATFQPTRQRPKSAPVAAVTTSDSTDLSRETKNLPKGDLPAATFGLAHALTKAYEKPVAMSKNPVANRKDARRELAMAKGRAGMFGGHGQRIHAAQTALRFAEKHSTLPKLSDKQDVLNHAEAGLEAHLTVRYNSESRRTRERNATYRYVDAQSNARRADRGRAIVPSKYPNDRKGKFKVNLPSASRLK